MLSALRERIHRRSTVDVDEAALGFDIDEIFAPEGVEAAGDAGALALPAFFRGVALKAGLISSLPLRWEIDGKPQATLPPILAQPDPTEPLSVTIKRMVASLVMRGNAIALLGAFDDLGFPNALKVLHPGDVSAVKQPSGRVVYRIAGTDYDPSQVMHARGLTLGASIMAVSPIEACRRSLAGAREVEAYGRRWFKGNGVPSAQIKVDRPREQLNEGELKALAAKWERMMAGGRRPVFVPRDITIDPITLSNEDSQFLETRKFSLTDIANIVGVPGYFVGAEGSTRTYANVQDERRALIDIYMREEIEAIEDAFTALLPAGKAKFDPASFLRLDQKQTAETLNIERSWMTIDEIRAVQGLEPLPDGSGRVLAAEYARRRAEADLPPTRATAGGGDQ